MGGSEGEDDEDDGWDDAAGLTQLCTRSVGSEHSPPAALLLLLLHHLLLLLLSRELYVLHFDGSAPPPSPSPLPPVPPQTAAHIIF